MFAPMAVVAVAMPVALVGGVTGGLIYRNRQGWETCTRIRLVRVGGTKS
jgi:hypothetical protein